MRETINIDCKHIWNAIQRLRKANADMNMVENEIARVISEYGVEQKHGYWIYNHGCQCSVCNRMSKNLSTYCQWCGAKMDEVTE